MTALSFTSCGVNATEETAIATETESRLERISEERALTPASEGDTIYLLPHYQIGSADEVEEGMISSEAQADDLAVKLTVPTGYRLEKTTKQVYIEYDLKDTYSTFFESDEDYVNSERWLLATDEEIRASELQLYYGLCEKEAWLQEVYETGTLQSYEVIGKLETAYGEAVLYKNPEIYSTEGEVDFYEYYIVVDKEPGPVIITFTDYHLDQIGQSPINLMKELFAAAP